MLGIIGPTWSLVAECAWGQPLLPFVPLQTGQLNAESCGGTWFQWLLMWKWSCGLGNPAVSPLQPAWTSSPASASWKMPLLLTFSLLFPILHSGTEILWQLQLLYVLGHLSQFRGSSWKEKQNYCSLKLFFTIFYWRNMPFTYIYPIPSHDIIYFGSSLMWRCVACGWEKELRKNAIDSEEVSR